MRVDSMKKHHLPSDCIYNIVRLIRTDMSTLYNICLVNRTWCNMAIKYLYQDPWSYFPYENWNQVGQSQRIARLISTLLSPLDVQNFSRNKMDQQSRASMYIPCDKNYIEMLTVLDLYWLKRALRLLSTKKFGHSPESFCLGGLQDLATNLVSLIMKHKPQQLEKLTLLDCHMIDLIDASDISFISLAYLDIRQRMFGKCTAKKIYKLCPNLVQLRISALFVDDVVTAGLIKRIKRDTLNKLCISGMLKSVTLIVRTLVQYHRDSLEEFSLDMNPGNVQEDVVDPFSNSDLHELSKFPNLKSLVLKGMYIDIEMVTDIAQQCSQLSKIHLSGPYVATGAAEILIVKLGRRLSELVINIEERCLGRVLLLIKGHCPNLKKLDIRGMEFDCDQLSQLAASCSKLVHVALGHPLYASTKSYNEMALSLIANCDQLEYLNFNRVYIGPQIVPNLLNHSSLKKIILPIPLLRSPSFTNQIIEFKTAILGEQGIFELYIKQR
ncbi:hypothetical protein K7432_008732 [Basidiobolus ranarum]|uniref:F-box domain-containing protein n=1 Tax=Basidiobolus ranarum TaxID=34480 RepID=A0ABR2WRE0_9FUNG